MTAEWNKQLQERLIKKFGPKQGASLYAKYANAFGSTYRDSCSPRRAASDIKRIERLSAESPLAIRLYMLREATDYPLHIRSFQWQQPTPLSDILPVLENLDLRTYDERTYKIVVDNHTIWIRDFSLSYINNSLDVKAVRNVFEEAVIQVYFRRLENDGFNRLILAAGLSWREVVILRTYAKYLHQINFRFSQTYIENALVHNPQICHDLIELFTTLHDPSSRNKALSKAKQIEKRINIALEQVNSLDEDRIIHTLLSLIKATLRTNYFKLNTENMPNETLAIKLNSNAVPNIPLPIPLYEIFVYSPQFEAVHLRGGKVARGGLRWSDRREDFRTEILGLMKAQKVKNSVIVPTGAKGGFVLKRDMQHASRDELKAEVTYCYKSFIRSMLDLTDNIINQETVPPKDVVCLDEADPYLVVAADKGTATFSDIANEISNDFNFWMGDAFASGGSDGYDHKKMGITARGAWESVKRHFRELDVDIKHQDITVVGIGDMSGDVFGNGMLYTDHIKLIAAFDHRHIFIDPDPDPARSFKERQRMFKLPVSSWEDYNPEIISKGGGVFKRTLKSITVTTQMKKVLGISASNLTPTELIQCILRAPVDLLFNGGIGTYVKATSEANADVGDRANDYTRINGNELRCRVVGEGGNLGFTQSGRIEYALSGGLINTDFIDNVGGVDCSDHEVNLKILLGSEIEKGRLSQDKRNKLLASLTEEVSDLVLHDCYLQALVMSFSAYNAAKNMSLHQNYIKELEDCGLLDRKVEFIPDEKQLLERKAAGLGLTRPELAILLAYTKIKTKQEIINSNLPEDAFFGEIASTAFPQAIRKKYSPVMRDHQLYRDIIATQLANKVINQMGITFFYRMRIETGATSSDVIRAHAVASHIFGTGELQGLIESLDFKIPMSLQYDMLFHLRNLINLSVRWFLQGNHLNGNILDTIKHYSRKVKELEHMIPVLMGGKTKEYMDNLVTEFTNAGLPDEIALRIATYRAIYTALNIIFVATENNLDLVLAAKVYFIAGERISILWFRDQIAHDTREGHWNSLARLSLRDELDYSQRQLTLSIMRNGKNETDHEKLIAKWMEKNKPALDRWDRMLAMIHTSNSVDYTMFFIAMRELMGIVTNAE